MSIEKRRLQGWPLAFAIAGSALAAAIVAIFAPAEIARAVFGGAATVLIFMAIFVWS